ncbi:MAG: hypothetical protein K0S81_2667 [Rhodospirillales bacterium]|jgi:hypothetical protein|nr:hypothetical protein [Rhodospirillales bacterium]
MFKFLKKLGLKKDLEQALADGVLSDDEVKYLDERSAELGIGEEYAHKQILNHYKGKVDIILRDIVSDRRMTPEQEEYLRQLALNFKIDLECDQKILECTGICGIGSTHSP